MAMNGTTPANHHSPQHLAIIMDGNGRWAERKGLHRELGHAEGAKAMERIVRAALTKHISFLSFYCFSTENWDRPKREVDMLMNLLRFYLKKNLKELARENIRIKIIGKRGDLPPDILKGITKIETETLNHDRMTLTLAINYGARAEIVQAVNNLVQKQAAGIMVGDITEEIIDQSLWTAELPPPDMIVRSSGEYRLSNFFLWQAAYSELIFTDRLWPDIDKEDLDLWLKEYEKRQRRFGGVDITRHRDVP